MLVDTDIIIDYLRGQKDAVTFLEHHIEEIHLSAMSVAELFQGVREGKERRQLDAMLEAFTLLPMDIEIAAAAGLLRRKFRDKFGCGLADCIIAATAIHHEMPVFTLNTKHFRMLDNVRMPYSKT